MAPTATPPSLQQALANSTTAWQDNLQALFDNAKEWFPDVVWEVIDEEAHVGPPEEVWGHKAMVYARAPPTFQARYFQFRPAPVASPTPYTSPPPNATQSAFSLSLGLDFDSRSPSPSPFRGPSPSPSTNTLGPLRIPAVINPNLFQKELEYLYTAKGLGEAFEFLFDTLDSREDEGAGADGDGSETRADKLRKDLVFMWRSRLYSDVRIALEGTFSSQNHETTMAIFSSHRFMLVARSPYFRTQFLNWGVHPTKPGEPLTVTLPSPPFTPASLHFTLGYIYTGTLVFSHRTYDLDTAFGIMRSALYLQIEALQDEVQARIVQEMLHGLFHAFLDFPEYESVTAGKWGVGGCRCRQCARRAPRVLEFATADDVRNPHLERGARRALVGLFGEGWCNAEFTGLPQKTRTGVLNGLAKRTTPHNVFALLFAAQHALGKIENVIDAWADISRDMIIAARKPMDRVICDSAEECFEQPEWLEIMDTDGSRFEDGERIVIVMDAVQRGLSDKNAAMVYQILVSSILLRGHAVESDQTALSGTSPIRAMVEHARIDVIRWLKKRWIGVRQENGFEALEDWALKEISHEIDVPVEELLQPSVSLSRSPVPTAGGLRVTNRTNEVDSLSMHSVRTGRSAAKPNGRAQDDGASMASSVRSVARSTHSTASRATATTTTASVAPRKKAHPGLGPRPDSKLTPSSTASSASSLAESFRSTQSRVKSGSSLVPKSAASPRSPVPSHSTPNNLLRPKSPATSTASTKSRASTIRHSRADEVLAGPSRPVSSVTASSDASTAFKTAKSEVSAPGNTATRPRRPSVTSTHSTRSVRQAKSPVPPTPKLPTAPRISTASSRASLASNASSVRSRRVTPTSPNDNTASKGLVAPRSVSSMSTRSTASFRSTASTTSTAAKRATPRKVSRDTKSPAPTIPKPVVKASPSPAKPVKSKAAKPLSDAGTADENVSQVSSSSASTATAGAGNGIKHKSSADTIRESKNGARSIAMSAALRAHGMNGPDGITLDIGIPCIITSNRAKFRALARYIGAVAGERGPWVGVEVPVGEHWPGERLEGRPWHDGSWNGVRYFDLGDGSDFDASEERAARRRRMDALTASTGTLSSKREGDALSVDRAKRFRSESPAISDISMSESRGLFVRPQQVLYVVDAVGSDM